MAPRTPTTSKIISDSTNAANISEDAKDDKHIALHVMNNNSGASNKPEGIDSQDCGVKTCRNSFEIKKGNSYEVNGEQQFSNGDCKCPATVVVQRNKCHSFSIGDSGRRKSDCYSKIVSDDRSDDCSDANNDNIDKDEIDDDDDGDDAYTSSDIPVDRGRAWLVMISCFLMHVLVVGGGKSFGVFVQEFQDRFQVGAKELGVINGMALMLMLGLGIFVNMLAVRFSARRVVTAGSILASAGFVLTAFIPSFNWLYVTYGLITGLGLALSFSPTIVMIGQCFKKYRSFALGFALSGAGFGAFAFPGLARALINQYGLRGCLMIIGALMSNVAVCGFLLPPHRRTSKKSRNNMEKEKLISKDMEDCEYPLTGSDDFIPTVVNVNNGGYRNYSQSFSGGGNGDGGEDRGFKSPNVTDSYKVIGEYLVNGNNITIEVMEDEAVSSEFEMGIDSSVELPRKVLDGKYNNGNRHQENIYQNEQSNHLGLNAGYISKYHANGSCDNFSSGNEKDTENQLSKSDNCLHVHDPYQVEPNRANFLSNQTCQKDRKSISTSYISDLLKPKSTHTDHNAITKSSHKKLSSSLAYISNCNIAMASQGNLDRRLSKTARIRDTNLGPQRGQVVIKEKAPLFEWSLLSSPSFIMHFFAAYMGYTCYITNLFMLADYAGTCGLDRDTAAFTLSVVGILELIARLTFPLITEVLCCRRRFAWAMSLAIMGLLNIIAPYMTVLSTIMAYAVMFGYSCGCFTCLIPVLCAEIKGPEKMGSAFGLTTIAMGSAVMTGPPICGAIKDMTGEWGQSFITAGTLSLLASILAFLEPYVNQRWDSNE